MNTEKIKYLRDELEITQNDIANILGCTRTAYSLWEINKNTIPLYYLNKLANEFDINIDNLRIITEFCNLFEKELLERKIIN